ncbi:ubinuclein-2b isoform X1 [Colossoma macropomum]|uniref:ubinuclein-2b isoform X1 n=1 Tax=Colossoma macropomum TaxID=42526 RepID=UPI001864DF9B|nr:ubinuclein-2b isoform X1 [Colossoma macropomum]
MADPRKVPFVTLASYSAAPESKKRRREEESEVSPHHPHHHHHLPRDGGAGAGAAGLFGAGKAPGGSGSGGGGSASGEPEPTVRLSLSLSEPSDHGSAEFSYSELVQQARKVPQGLPPPLDPNDPFADEDRERREVEALAKKFESKYGNAGRKKKKDRMQDLIDIGYGYDETDPFIDNSEAYDELVPASLTTKLGGFYINTGTLQFRAASESEDEEGGKDGNHFKKLKDGEERVIKKRKKKDGSLEEKKPRKNRVPKPGVSALNRPEKKKRKKLMKDSLSLAAMIRRFTREKEEMRKKNPVVSGPLKVPRGPTNANRAMLNSNSVPPGNDLSMADLTNDPVMSLLGSANDNEMLQDLMGDLDFALLDPTEPSSPGQGENGSAGAQRGGIPGRVQRTGLMPPPPLPDGLPAPLIKRIEDLRAASRQFDMEGRKKFFTLDMNNILLDIELQVQEQPAEVRSAVYSHLEAFVPCNKEALLKRLKKLSLNVQDDRLKKPLLKLKLAVCSAMPEQIARYNMDCMAKVAKQMSEDGERNGSEDEDEEKPGKRVMGPRKKFVWDDKLRALLCNLVRVKLGCYEAEGQNSPSPEDYLKAFMETEVKPLWPKGWMQARMLIKESRMAHGHLTGNTVKKKMVPTPKVKPKPQDGGWVQQPTASMETGVQQPGLLPKPPSPSEPICLSDSLDEDLGGAPSLDSISQALALLSSAAKGLIQSDSPASPEGPKPSSPTAPHTSTTPLPKKTSTTTAPSVPAAAVPLATSSPHFVSSPSPSISRPPSVSISSSPAVRSEGLAGVKIGVGGVSQAQRHSVMTAQRPVVAVSNKLSMPGTPSPPKPRPPPTASPLLPPHKSFSSPVGKLPMATSPSQHKSSNNNGSRIGDISLSSRPPVLPTSSTTPSSSASSSSSSTLLAAKTPQALHLPQSKNAPHESPRPVPSPSPSQPKPQHQQSNFITPMHATLTKSPHSSNSPILKLTPRVSTPSVATSSPSPSPTLRPPTLPSVHQYSSKSPGFHAGFSGVRASYSAPVGQQKNSSQVNSGNLTSTPSSITKPPTSASPIAGSANHGQRQRPAGMANQGTKTMASVSSASASQLPQVSSSSGALLGSGAPNLPLGFGMLGGLVPVSLPFQFPGLLNLPTPTVTAAAASSANPTSSGYSLPPNLLKGLMSGAQAALPPHLQLAFSGKLWPSPPSLPRSFSLSNLPPKPPFTACLVAVFCVHLVVVACLPSCSRY